MRIVVDCSHFPPVASLEDADVFTAFDVVIERPEHVWVTVEQLSKLAGDRAADPEWRKRLDAMVAYAESKGWVDEAGRIRAHVASADL